MDPDAGSLCGVFPFGTIPEVAFGVLGVSVLMAGVMPTTHEAAILFARSIVPV
jgi:hypothetical protein